MEQKKLLLIGWDAADWQILEPLLAEGKLPALQQMLKAGVRGNISTLSPVLSPMLWTSIATGKRAYEHGIHGFVEVDKISGNIRPVRATTRKAKTIWNILNEAGLKTNVVNWWPSHPAERLKGAMVSNQFHKEAPAFGEDWPLEKSAIYPHELYQELKELRLHPAELTLAHISPFMPKAAALNPERDAVLKPFMRVLAHCASVHNAATYLMENTKWDFMAVYYEAIDHFSHLAMKYHPPRLEGIDENEFELYKGIVEGAYRYHDMMLERLLSLAGPDCTVVLLSDHGFQSGKGREVELPDVPAAPALEHRKYGVFVAKGPEITTSEQVYGASLLDIAPTVLHHFGLPVGEDMEGRVLKDIFKVGAEPGFIPSWEIIGSKPEFEEDTDPLSTGMLKQLEELGYINLSTENKVAYVESELSYNLCVSLLDGNKLESAKELSKEFYSKGGEQRFGLLLAMSLLRLGEVEGLEELLTALEKRFSGQQAIVYFKGLLALRQGEPKEALSCFKGMESKGVVSIELLVELGKAMLIAGELKESMRYFNKALQLDAENAAALTGKAQCQLEKNRAAEALPTLEKSLEQQFYQPNAHYLMAQAAKLLGHDEVARKALQICLKQAPKHKGAGALWSAFTDPSKGAKQAVIVVTGLPRSGTSMMMKMLKQAGLSLYIDQKRPGDEHNPAGYYEHENVKGLGLKNDWLPDARSKVVKVVSPLLRYLPASEFYKVIWIKRPLTEVVVSQEVMQGKSREKVMREFPFQMAMEMQEADKRLENWLTMQPQMESLTVEYYDCMENAKEVLEKIQAFLKMPMGIEEGARAVNKNLHRNKLGK